MIGPFVVVCCAAAGVFTHAAWALGQQGPAAPTLEFGDRLQDGAWVRLDGRVAPPLDDGAGLVRAPIAGVPSAYVRLTLEPRAVLGGGPPLHFDLYSDFRLRGAEGESVLIRTRAIARAPTVITLALRSPNATTLELEAGDPRISAHLARAGWDGSPSARITCREWRIPVGGRVAIEGRLRRERDDYAADAGYRGLGRRWVLEPDAEGLTIADLG